ncbi:MAG: hypothetical protein NTZ79_02940 [Proteobacteria bacterium]|nr:hypothetical protein [Pseudomonadota bacterium]
MAIAISAFAVAAPAGALPSATIGRPALVSPAAAEAAFPTLADGTSTSTLSTTAYPNEVIELARALGSNVDEIYDFVRNYVDTTFIFGAQKGALGSIVDKSGTPFDQAQLMVNLLRQSGYAANYQLGTITLTGADFQAWTKITNAQAACDLLASGGIPGIVNGVTSTMCAAPAAGLAGATVSTLTMEHVWVDVVIPIGGSTHYVFDPSYKPYTFTNGANIHVRPGLAFGLAHAGRNRHYAGHLVRLWLYRGRAAPTAHGKQLPLQLGPNPSQHLIYAGCPQPLCQCRGHELWL